MQKVRKQASKHDVAVRQQIWSATRFESGFFLEVHSFWIDLNKRNGLLLVPFQPKIVIQSLRFECLQPPTFQFPSKSPNAEYWMRCQSAIFNSLNIFVCINISLTIFIRFECVCGLFSHLDFSISTKKRLCCALKNCIIQYINIFVGCFKLLPSFSLRTEGHNKMKRNEHYVLFFGTYLLLYIHMTLHTNLIH